MWSDGETASRYRQRAEELRIIAENMQDTENRQTLLNLADHYDGLARQMTGKPDDAEVNPRKVKDAD